MTEESRTSAEVGWAHTVENESFQMASQKRHKRMVGLVHGVIGVLAGLAIYIYWSEVVGIVVWSITGVSLLASLVSPLGAYVLIERAFGWLAQLVGTIITFASLAPVYYLIFVPMGLLFRRGSNDRLARRFSSGKISCWEDHSPMPDDIKSYTNQF